jgi:nicotinamide-nucleotide amidase
MRIEIICTGDEILSGKIVNTNYAYISRRLDEVGLDVVWGTTVGDDRDNLLASFLAAGERADAVIVNGGLGPTVDDLSQEIAAKAAGDILALNTEWLGRMEAFFLGRGREMPANNRKQAMLPQSSEMIDNPVGTACGFALNIGKARFFFTPGVPRELYRMLNDELIPRLTEMRGGSTLHQLKRFHSFGIGESRADRLLEDVVNLAPNGSVKLGFQAHYPQLETKLAVRGSSEEDILRNLEPVETEVRNRLGSFVFAEDDSTLEGVVLDHLGMRGQTISVCELGTNGLIASRLTQHDEDGKVFRRGLLGGSLEEIFKALGLNNETEKMMPETAKLTAGAFSKLTGSTHCLSVQVKHNPAQPGKRASGTIAVALAQPDGILLRQSEIIGDAHRVRLGAVELGLDYLRRVLHLLPLDERSDFEKS